MTKPIRAKISALGTYVPPRLLTNADLEKWSTPTTNGSWRGWASASATSWTKAWPRAISRSRPPRRRWPSAVWLPPTSMRSSSAPSRPTCFSLDRLPGAGQAGRQGSLGIRSFRRLLGFSLFDAGGSAVHCQRGSQAVLVIGADVMSSIIDYADRATCVIFGDGAGAAILEPAEDDSVGLIDFIHEVDGSGGSFSTCPAEAV